MPPKVAMCLHKRGPLNQRHPRSTKRNQRQPTNEGDRKGLLRRKIFATRYRPKYTKFEKRSAGALESGNNEGPNRHPVSHSGALVGPRYGYGVLACNPLARRRYRRKLGMFKERIGPFSDCGNRWRCEAVRPES